MVKKIYLSILIITICAVLVSTVSVFLISNHHYNEQIADELEKEAQYVSAGYSVGGNEYLEELRDLKMRVTLVSYDGTVLFDSAADPSSMGNHLDREEITEAIENGYGEASRFSDTLSIKTDYYALRLDDGNVIRVSSEQKSIPSMLLDMITPMLIAGALTLVAGGAVAFALTKNIVRPINSIDIDRPESSHTYKELRPIVEKLSQQRVRINKQIAELQIRQSEFEAITSNMSEGMITIDSRANLLTCNASAQRILNLTKLPASALALSDHPIIKQAVLAPLTGARFEDSVRIDGLYYRIIASPVTEDSIVQGAVIMILDETEKLAREALRREFTSNVSHELRTPLTSISGFAELIRDGDLDRAQSIHFADNIHRESARMLSLIADIIKLSQLDGKEIPFDRTRIDLYDTAATVAERLEAIAARNGISISVQGEPQYIEGNANIVEDMIYNLCDNAIKYNKEGGYVTVSVGQISSRPFFCVKDGGIGIPPAEKERVFERFYRVDKSRSKQIGGTGLGLSIVKHAAIYHNARIELESRLGEGTSVTVIF